MYWKLYAWFILVLNVLAVLFFSPLMTKVVGFDFLAELGIALRGIAWIDVPISVAALVGVFGYAYRRPIATRGLWGTCAVLVVAWDMLVNFGVINHFASSTTFELSSSIVRGSVITLLTLPLVAPAYLALFFYAYELPRMQRPALDTTAEPVAT